MYVHVYGLHYCGLGNILFQVAAAIYYAEKYNYKIILKRTYPICFGTSNMFGREKMSTMGMKQYKTYDKTIFKKFMFDNGYIEDSIVVSNYFSDIKINPEGRHVIIDCYSQNIQLFYEYIHEIPKYLYLDDIRTQKTDKALEHALANDYDLLFKDDCRNGFAVLRRKGASSNLMSVR
jgi:hypothetical protein